MNDLRDDFTWRLLTDSGIKKGMRVLDVGCGTGDLSFLASELVGDSGAVVGFDISENALVAARSTVEKKSLSTVKFVQADISELPDDIGIFDAIIGRRILMYLNNAAQGIDCLLPHLTATGKMVFQESDCMASSFCALSMPLHTRVQSWIWDTVAKEGGDIHIGRRLYSLMKNAKLKILQIRAEAILHTCESGSDLGWVAKIMAPRMISHGVVTAEEMDTDALEDRLQLELSDSDTPFIRDMAFGVCAGKRFDQS
ncbi:MAG: methyltransferase domain-containing protein [Synergistaceae bacterium]|jgi:2-polyprenyl-3-methyl-5-hydroxy-6-metoxy-1,4-benzoquinol methylase|nr:methyltransferase domain-containing protein [Synergistaceae bacterium]